MCATDDRHILVRISGDLTHWPGLGKRHTVNASQDIHSVWSHADLENKVRFRQLGLSQISKRGPKGPERHQDPTRIVSFAVNPHVEILGKSWFCVQRNRIATDEQIPSVRAVQLCKQISEV